MCGNARLSNRDREYAAVVQARARDKSRHAGVQVIGDRIAHVVRGLAMLGTLTGGKHRKADVFPSTPRTLEPMRWIACVVLLAGCLRARATVVHPTEHERSSNSGSSTTIARGTSETPEPAPSSNIGSLEVGALFPFRNNRDTARVHIAPGIRVLQADDTTLMAGVAIGA